MNGLYLGVDVGTSATRVSRAHDRGVPHVGGALTPTEVLVSMRAGSDAVKLFPAGSMGGAGSCLHDKSGYKRKAPLARCTVPFGEDAAFMS